jgi:hypothetical protein
MKYLRSLRKLHRFVAPLLFLPLLLTVITGIVFDLSDTYFNFPEKVNNVLISIHKGGYLGEKLSVVYVILNGIGTFAMLITGISMLIKFNRQKKIVE